MIRSTLALLVTGSAAAQPDMLVTVEDFNGDGFWSLSAEFLSTPPSDIVQVWADVDIVLRGDSPIWIGDINPSYFKAGLGGITNNGTEEVFFVGNANAFFGTPDTSNPLSVLDFQYAGSVGALSLDFVGQNSAIFDLAPFGDVRLYQDNLGNPGELSFEIRIVPAPAAVSVAPVVLLAATRRRRR